MNSRLNDYYKSKINYELIISLLVELEKLFEKDSKTFNFRENLILNYDIDYFNGILFEHDKFDIIVTKNNVFLSTYTETKVKLNIELEKCTGTYEDVSREVARMIEGCLSNKGKKSVNA